MAVRALDAAMPFDFEAKAQQIMRRQARMKIGIIGFGTFGQFLARRLAEAGHEVLATSRRSYQAEAQAMGVTFCQDADDLCEAHPDVVVLACSILAAREVLAALPVGRLRRSTLFVDVLSVKGFPKQLMLSQLPAQVDIMCTHPMFGPDSGKGPWTGLNFMYERVRIGAHSARQKRAAAFLEFFEREGCRMVEMTCEEHDRHAASTQFITHTVGRMLGKMGPKSTPIDTRGYESLLNLVDNTTHDSFDLYYGLFMYNPNATRELERLETAFTHVRQTLFSRLHEAAAAQTLPYNAQTAKSESPEKNDMAGPPLALLGGPTSRGAEDRTVSSLEVASSSEEEDDVGEGEINANGGGKNGAGKNGAGRRGGVAVGALQHSRQRGVENPRQ